MIMEELNILPIYRNGIGEITNGIDITVPQFCRKNCESDKCRMHYNKMCKADEGLYECPFGFSSYVFEIENENCIFTCLRVEKSYMGKQYKEITYSNLENYAKAYKEYWYNQRKYEQHRDLINDILHDVRKYNQQLKIKNEKIFRASQEKKSLAKFNDLSKGISVLSWYLTLRLNNYDFVYNEELMKADVPSSYNLYGIIYKVKHCIKEKADEKSIDIIMEANRQCRDIEAYDCIELLPFLLVDNAIKYSPNNEIININIEEKAKQQYVQIKSLGPAVSDNELLQLFNQGYRGEGAKQVTTDGMGIGLYTAKCICDLNGIQISINSSKNVKKTINKVRYSEFCVDFWKEL